MDAITQPQRLSDPFELYDLLRDYAAGPAKIEAVVIGLVWTLCRIEEESFGLAMSPGVPTRTLPWAGTLQGRSLSELAGWVRDFDPYKATLGMAAVNAGLNRLHPPPPGIDLPSSAAGNNNLAVFEHFLPRLKGKRVVVLGRYPGLDGFQQTHKLDLKVLERQPGPDDLTDAACEFLLPSADWVFLTATSIPNKTFPRLASLCRKATTVLMGPTTPWLPELYHFGMDYLAGVVVDDGAALLATAAEGGGTRIFDGPVHYRVVELSRVNALNWAREMIARTYAERQELNGEMESWYASHEAPARFPHLPQLEAISQRLSRLDTCFKRLWDEQQKLGGAA